MNGNYVAYSSTELLTYDNKTRHLEFSSSTNLPTEMLGHCITRVNNSTIFLGGGNRLEAYLFDENTSTFTKLPRLIHQRIGAACSVVQYDNGSDVNGTVIMLVGGSNTADDSTYVTTEVIDIDSLDKWVLGPDVDLNGGWANGGYATYTSHMDSEKQGLILVSGVDVNRKRHNHMYYYDQKNQSFKSFAKLISYPREYPSIAIIHRDEINCNESSILDSFL